MSEYGNCQNFKINVNAINTTKLLFKFFLCFSYFRKISTNSKLEQNLEILSFDIFDIQGFSSSVMVSLKEFSPDNIILLGPGNSLGGPVAQVLIDHNWNDLHSKDAFIESQKNDPFLICMGIEEQRDLVL